MNFKVNWKLLQTRLIKLKQIVGWKNKTHNFANTLNQSSTTSNSILFQLFQIAFQNFFKSFTRNINRPMSVKYILVSLLFSTKCLIITTFWALWETNKVIKKTDIDWIPRALTLIYNWQRRLSAFLLLVMIPREVQILNFMTRKFI